MTHDRVRLRVDEARELSKSALCGIGYPEEDARIITDHVIDAALCGYEYSGLAKILNLPESPRFKLPRRPMTVLHETDVSVAYDGGNNVGMVALYHATEAVIAKARAPGFSLVAVTNAWMSGRSAYYVEMIAKAGLVAIHTASSSRAVAPIGGARPMLGTNPIAFGIPAADNPLILDMGTSAFMMTELMLRERLGELLPEGVALGPDGEPTQDPAKARQGALLPFGGHKGFGLGLIVQALGVLAGSALDTESDNGYLFVAFKPELLMPAGDFKEHMSSLIERIKATPRRAGVNEIRIPSERAFRSRERALREGLEIDRSVYEALGELCTRDA